MATDTIRTIPRFTAGAAGHYAAAREKLILAGRLIDKADAAEREGEHRLAATLHEEVRDLHAKARAEMAAAEEVLPPGDMTLSTGAISSGLRPDGR